MGNKLKRIPDPRLKEALKNFDEKVTVEKMNLAIVSSIGKISVAEAGIEKTTVTEDNGTLLSTVTKKISIRSLCAAPAEWNIWKPMDDYTKVGTLNSILKFHLLHNLVLWEVPADKKHLTHSMDYMILSGHNRVDLLEIAYEITKNEEFIFANARIFKGETINKAIAVQIINDANDKVRGKSTIEKSAIFASEYKTISEDPLYKDYYRNDIISIIASKYPNFKDDAITEYIDIHRVDPVFNPYIDKKVITKKGAKKLSAFSLENQLTIANYLTETPEKEMFINDKTILKLNRAMTIDTLLDVLNELTSKEEVDLDEIVEVKFKVKKSLKQDLINLYKEFNKHNK